MHTDSRIDLRVQQLLNPFPNFGFGRKAAGKLLRYSLLSGAHVLADLCPDLLADDRPGIVARLCDGNLVFRNKQVFDLRNLKQPLGQGRESGRFPVAQVRRSTGIHRPVEVEFARRGIRRWFRDDDNVFFQGLPPVKN